MRRFWAGTALVLLATALTFGVGSASAATPTTLTVSETGQGTVTGSGINCGGGNTGCFASYSENSGTTHTTMTATPAAGWTFDSWSGDAADNDCAGTVPTCDITLDGSEHRITAHFTQSGSA